MGCRPVSLQAASQSSTWISGMYLRKARAKGPLWQRSTAGSEGSCNRILSSCHSRDRCFAAVRISVRRLGWDESIATENVLEWLGICRFVFETYSCNASHMEAWDPENWENRLSIGHPIVGFIEPGWFHHVLYFMSCCHVALEIFWQSHRLQNQLRQEQIQEIGSILAPPQQPVGSSLHKPIYRENMQIIRLDCQWFFSSLFNLFPNDFQKCKTEVRQGLLFCSKIIDFIHHSTAKEGSTSSHSPSILSVASVGWQVVQVGLHCIYNWVTCKNRKYALTNWNAPPFSVSLEWVATVPINHAVAACLWHPRTRGFALPGSLPAQQGESQAEHNRRLVLIINWSIGGVLEWGYPK